MKIYIAGPMTGIPDYNYPAFALAAQQLNDAGFTAINPAFHELGNGVREWQFYMRHGLRLLMDAEAVATLPGWCESRGALLEIQTAKALTIPVKALQEWLSMPQKDVP